MRVLSEQPLSGTGLGLNGSEDHHPGPLHDRCGRGHRLDHPGRAGAASLDERAAGAHPAGATGADRWVRDPGLLRADGRRRRVHALAAACPGLVRPAARGPRRPRRWPDVGPTRSPRRRARTGRAPAPPKAGTPAAGTIGAGDGGSSLGRGGALLGPGAPAGRTGRAGVGPPSRTPHPAAQTSPGRSQPEHAHAGDDHRREEAPGGEPGHERERRRQGERQPALVERRSACTPRMVDAVAAAAAIMQRTRMMVFSSLSPSPVPGQRLLRQHPLELPPAPRGCGGSRSAGTPWRRGSRPADDDPRGEHSLTRSGGFFGHVSIPPDASPLDRSSSAHPQLQPVVGSSDHDRAAVRDRAAEDQPWPAGRRWRSGSAAAAAGRRTPGRSRSSASHSRAASVTSIVIRRTASRFSSSAELEVDDLGQVLPGQGVEDDDLVEPVEELRLEALRAPSPSPTRASSRVQRRVDQVAASRGCE